MLIIEDRVIVSDDVIREQFVCQLEACRGACCWEGDYGAPLEESELETLQAIFPLVRPYLRPDGIAAIEAQGTAVYVERAGIHATTLVENQACAYMTIDQQGVAHCGIEQAYNEGVVDFKKPISCHLYPIRVEQLRFHEALNYDRWDICSAACTNGEALAVPIYRFVKEALIRKYGEDFYAQLEAAADYYLNSQQEK